VGVGRPGHHQLGRHRPAARPVAAGGHEALAEHLAGLHDGSAPVGPGGADEAVTVRADVEHRHQVGAGAPRREALDGPIGPRAVEHLDAHAVVVEDDGAVRPPCGIAERRQVGDVTRREPQLGRAALDVAPHGGRRLGHQPVAPPGAGDHECRNRAGRFSVNAAMPSFWSSVANRAWNTRRSNRTPSARVVS
jgi:hypothetical protein